MNELESFIYLPDSDELKLLYINLLSTHYLNAFAEYEFSVNKCPSHSGGFNRSL